MEQGRDSTLKMEDFLSAIEGRAFRLAQIATGNRDDALELLQEAMIKLVRNYAERTPEEWTPLFYSILQSAVRDWHRRQAVRNRFRTWFAPRDEEDEEDPLEQQADDGSHEPSLQLERGRFLTQLESELGAMPYRQQQAFLLRAWEGMDIAQTAAAMQCSESSVKTHYARALHRLREQLEGFR